jgi:hypothetical protein
MKILYDMKEINHVKVMIFECSLEPDQEHAFTRTISQGMKPSRDVHYEAYRVDKNRTFFSSKTPPTDEELAFQLNNAIKRDDMAFKIMMVAFGLLALFYLFAR